MSDKAISADDARALLEREAAEREERCRQELQQVLDKYGCKIDIALILRAGQAPQVQMRIVSV